MQCQHSSFQTYEPSVTCLFSYHYCTLRLQKHSSRKVPGVAVIAHNCPESSRLHKHPSMVQECQAKKKCKSHKRCSTGDSSVEVRTCPNHCMIFFHSELLSDQETETVALDSHFYTYIKVLYDELCYKNVKYHYDMLHLIRTEDEGFIGNLLIRTTNYNKRKIKYNKLQKVLLTRQYQHKFGKEAYIILA